MNDLISRQAAIDTLSMMQGIVAENGGGGMSVLIKGMEMPKSGELLIIITSNGEVRYKKSGAYIWDRTTAVPVPPHGRLIDADALCDGLVSNHPVAIYAKTAPTIIEAEKQRRNRNENNV